MITFLAGILTGICITVLGQSLVKFVIEPIKDQSSVIGRIASSLVYYANVNSGSENREASNALREHAGNLLAATNSIPAYAMFERIRVVPKKMQFFKLPENSSDFQTISPAHRS